MDLFCTALLVNCFVLLLGIELLKVLLSYEKQYSSQNQIINIFKDKKVSIQKCLSVEFSQ